MLELKDICVSFRSERQDKLFGTSRDQVLFDVSLQVEKGSCLGILGETGSGKIDVGRVLCRTFKTGFRQVLLDGRRFIQKPSGRRIYRRKISIFSGYTTSANPRFRIRDILAEDSGQQHVKRESGFQKKNKRCRRADGDGGD